MSADEQDELDAWQQEHKDLIGWRRRCAAYMLANESGDPLFQNESQVEQLGRLSARQIDEIIKAGSELSALSAEAIELAKKD